MFGHFFEKFPVLTEKLLDLFLAFLVNFHGYNYAARIFKTRRFSKW